MGGLSIANSVITGYVTGDWYVTLDNSEFYVNDIELGEVRIEGYNCYVADCYFEGRLTANASLNLSFISFCPGYRSFEGYAIPQQIILTDKDENYLSLTVERYLPDVDVDPSLFVLKKPG